MSETELKDFIGIYPELLSRTRCNEMIQQFDSSKLAVPGQVGAGLMPELKNSRDIQLNKYPQWQAAENELNTAMFRALMQYVREYPFVMIAPLMVQLKMKDSSVKRIDHQDVASMDEKTLSDLLRAVFRPGEVNLQRYEANEGGYPYWHCEHYPKDQNSESLHRTLLWTAYLNEEFEEGETEFFYQQRKVRPTTGTFIIAPSAFTHTHRGNMPKNGSKYIATSWILFNRPEALYPRGR
jgi:hypothetical protein